MPKRKLCAENTSGGSIAYRSSSHRDDIILEPFGGSGSTLIACEKTGRVCCGIELDPLYVDVIIRRYQRVTEQEVILDETGETFDELEKRRMYEAGG